MSQWVKVAPIKQVSQRTVQVLAAVLLLELQDKDPGKAAQGHTSALASAIHMGNLCKIWAPDVNPVNYWHL